MADAYWPPSTSGGVTTLSGLSDTQITSASDRDRLEFDISIGKWKNIENVSLITFEETGFPNRTDTTLAASVAAGFGGTVTLGKVGAEFDIYGKGEKITKTADEVFTVPATTGLYFCKYSVAGVASISTTPWSILTDIPIANIYYNDATGDYFLGEERHGMTMDNATHYRLHFGGGAAYYTGLGASGYVLNSDTLADVQIALSSGTFGDEDITNSLSAKAEGDNFDKWYRSGSAGDWQKDTADTIPAFHATNVPKWNEDTGATWQLTNVTNNYYFNTYIFATNSAEAANRFVLIPGQAEYANDALAEQENVNSLVYGDLPSPEIIPIYKIRLQYKTSYTGNNARVEIVEVEDLRGSNNPGIAASATSHNSLGGRADADAHPSQSINVTDVTLAGQLDSTTELNLGQVLERLDDFGYVSNWATTTAYRVGNVVKVDHKLFQCVTAHTSGTFDTDLTTNGYWQLVGSGGISGSLQTTDATTTTIASCTVPSNVACRLQVKVTAFESATGDCKSWDLFYNAKNVAGTLTVQKVTESVYEDAGASAWTAIVDNSGTTLRIRVTGEAAHTIEWHAVCQHSYF